MMKFLEKKKIPKTEKLLNTLGLKIQEEAGALKLTSNSIGEQAEGLNFSAVVGNLFVDSGEKVLTYRYDAVELNAYQKMDQMKLVKTPTNLWFGCLDEIVVQLAKELKFNVIEVLANAHTSNLIEQKGYKKCQTRNKRFKYSKTLT